MRSFEERPEDAAIRQVLSSNLAELLAINPDELVRVEELGSALSFQPALPVIVRTLDLFDRVRRSDLVAASNATVNLLASRAREAINSLEQISKFNPQSETNPIGVRDSLIANLEANYHVWYVDAISHVAYAERRADQAEELVAATTETLSDVVAHAKEEREHVRAEFDQAKQIVGDLRKLAEEASVSRNARHFMEEAAAQRASSNWWLGAVIASALALIIYVLAVVEPHLRQITPGAAPLVLIPGAVSRFAIFSVGFYLLVFCGRSYAASRHNYIVNKHRANALNTFEAFRDGTTDELTKNAIVLQAATSIFAPQTSGYLKDEPEAPQPQAVVQVVRDAVAKPQ